MRWTIRNVEPWAVAAIRAMQMETGAPLGAILSEVIRNGLSASRERLLAAMDEEPNFADLITQSEETMRDLERVIATLQSHA